MTPRTMHILLIEDNPGDARLIREMLSDGKPSGLEIEHADRLSDGLRRLGGGGFDVVLLDLSLPDSDGLESLNRILERPSSGAVIVLTGLDDEEAGLRAVEAGAQDYLVKGRTDASALRRSIRYGVQRRRGTDANEANRRRREREAELASFEMLGDEGPSPITSEMLGSRARHRMDPRCHSELLRSYLEILERALEQRGVETRQSVPDDLRALARSLSDARAGPGDVIDLHAAVLRAIPRGRNSQKMQARADESRLMVLALMGHLVSHYRLMSLGATTRPAEVGDRAELPQEPARRPGP